jgi:hypothetical protein
VHLRCQCASIHCSVLGFRSDICVLFHSVWPTDGADRRIAASDPCRTWIEMRRFDREKVDRGSVTHCRRLRTSGRIVVQSSVFNGSKRPGRGLLHRQLPIGRDMVQGRRTRDFPWRKALLSISLSQHQHFSACSLLRPHRWL